MKVLITGSSGLIGSALVAYFRKKGDQVFKFVRVRSDLHEDEIAYDSERGVINPDQLEGFDAVVHLAGETIMGRWTNAKKKRIRESRVNGTTLLARTLAELKRPPGVLISASAVGYYGDRGKDRLDEESSPGEGFLAGVCQQWEAAARAVSERRVRVVNLRIGMVLSAAGGALKQMLLPFQMGVGGPIGSGEQMVSWIALDDLVRAIDFIIQTPSLSGPVNCTAPFPVSNCEFAKTLGEVLHRPAFLAIPSFMVRLVFGRLGDELLLSSTCALPKKLENSGFQFNTPHLYEALKAVLKK